VAYSYRLYPPADYSLRTSASRTCRSSRRSLTSSGRHASASTTFSGWNPNVTLELALALGFGEKAFVAIDPARTQVDEVPSDLRGLDRIQYGSLRGTRLEAGNASGTRGTPLGRIPDRVNAESAATVDQIIEFSLLLPRRQPRFVPFARGPPGARRRGPLHLVRPFGRPAAACSLAGGSTCASHSPAWTPTRRCGSAAPRARRISPSRPFTGCATSRPATALERHWPSVRWPAGTPTFRCCVTARRGPRSGAHPPARTGSDSCGRRRRRSAVARVDKVVDRAGDEAQVIGEAS
jgi:hypothetical protein